MNETWETNEHQAKKPRIHRNKTSEKTKLEHYLTKAGLFDDFPYESKNSAVTCQEIDLTNLSPNEWIDVHTPVMNIVPYQIAQQTYTNARMTTSPTLSVQSASDVQAFEWKKVVRNGITEESLQREEERKIKSRESAVRSRARKKVQFHKPQIHVIFMS